MGFIHIFIFLIILFLYIHITQQLKKSEDLEIYEMDYNNNTQLQDVCDLKQPILFNYSTVNPDFIEEINIDLLSKHDSYDVRVKDITDYWKDDTNVDYAILPFKSTLNLLKTDTNSRFFTENNDDFIHESGLNTLFAENDTYIKPSNVINTKYDIILGSTNTVTPLRYHTNSQQFLILNSGKITVKMTPWKSGRYLHEYKDYENYEFRSPINVWNTQDQYKNNMDKLKFLEFQVNPGYALFIPPFWWYSIKFSSNSDTLISGITYSTIMNSISNIPNHLLFFIQQHNIQKKVTRSLQIGSNNETTILKSDENIIETSI